MRVFCMCLVLSIASCAIAPGDTPVGVVALTASESQSKRESFEFRHGGRLNDVFATEIERIVNELTADDWSGPDIKVAILSSPDPNAYVLSGGHLYVTAGLLDIACTQSELAAVLAHELAHLEDPYSFAGFRSMEERLEVETEADARALQRLIGTRYDANDLILMIARLADAQPDGWADWRCRRLQGMLHESPDATSPAVLASLP